MERLGTDFSGLIEALTAELQRQGEPLSPTYAEETRYILDYMPDLPLTRLAKLAEHMLPVETAQRIDSDIARGVDVNSEDALLLVVHIELVALANSIIAEYLNAAGLSLYVN